VSFLLDTNVVSEWVKPRPDAGLAAWLHGIDENDVFLSVVTFAEIRQGIERITGARRGRLEEWLANELPARFEGHILDIDRAVADACGRWLTHSRRIGRPIGPMDAFVAATAEVHELTLVTRNVSDFNATSVPLLNPWTGN
jgi:predicted nucleic acid-binding protein